MRHFIITEVMYKFVGESLQIRNHYKTKNRMSFNRVSQNRLNNEPTSEKEQTGEGEPSEEFDQEPQSQSESSDPFEVSTDEAFSDGAQALTNNPSRGPEYYEVPQLKTSDYVISNTEIDNHTRTWFSQYQGNEFVDPDSTYNRFKKIAQREVNYLVKEFECKKSE